MSSPNHEDYELEDLLADIRRSLTTGSNMNRANFAFVMLCDKLGVDEDELDWRWRMNELVREQERRRKEQE